ncbi:hypothetical protein JW948_02445 [bacterium]|nr:hypothetical protein [bacterium]
MLFRTLMLFLAGYFAFHFFKGLFSGESPGPAVRGRKKSQPMDLKREDVEDAKFRDIEED